MNIKKIANKPPIKLLEEYCIPPLGAEDMDDMFNKYGFTQCGIGDEWIWFTKDNITEYAIEKGHKPIEEATNEELWRMIALTNIYWEKEYENWYTETLNEYK